MGEKSKDELKVEEFLTEVTSTALSYKTMVNESEKQPLFSYVDLRGLLSPGQIELLFSDKYLNVKPLTDYELKTGSARRSTALPYLEVTNYTDRSVNLAITNLIDEADVASAESAFIRKLLEDYKLRARSFEAWEEKLDERITQFQNESIKILNENPELNERASRFDLVAEQALFLSSLWTASKSGSDITLEKMREVVDTVEQHKNIEDSIDKSVRMLGCEIEIPYTGSFRDQKVRGARYVFLPEHLDLLTRLYIPIERDKQGEAAIPPSRSPAIQYGILDQLRQMGFCPENADLNYTLHVNVSLTEPEYTSFEQEFLSFSPDEMSGLSALGNIVGARYSSTSRILTGAYRDPAYVKGEDPSTYRLEFRTLEYDPSESEESFTSKLDNIRKAAGKFLEYHAEKEHPEQTKYGQLLLAIAHQCISEEDRDVSKAEMLISIHIQSIVKDPEKKRILGKLFDEFLEN